MDLDVAREIINDETLSDKQLSVLLLKAQRQAANHHFWRDNDEPTEEQLEKFYARYEFEIYEVARAMNSDDARGGLVSHTELGVSRSWGETGKETVNKALAAIPPKTYIG